MTKSTSVETPQPASPASRPAERVPILIEITEEDRQNAAYYTDRHNCIVCCSLKRIGYHHVEAGPDSLTIDGQQYISDEINAAALYNNCDPLKPPFYDPEVVGKQIILYPV